MQVTIQYISPAGIDGPSYSNLDHDDQYTMRNWVADNISFVPGISHGKIANQNRYFCNATVEIKVRGGRSTVIKAKSEAEWRALGDACHHNASQIALITEQQSRLAEAANVKRRVAARTPVAVTA